MIASLAAAPLALEARTVVLPTGVLDIEVTAGVVPLDDLCDFAARRNPKRGFLFVSKVLGRYTSVPVHAAVASQDALAARIPAALPGPVVILALAEAGVGLGAGVFAAYRGRTGRDDVVFLHSTRHRCAGEALVTFDESHSHAPRHVVFRPRDRLTRTLVEHARSLVLVDDEVTTGRTFAELCAALRPVMPHLRETWPLVLTDWTGDRALPDGTPVHALVHGRYRFRAAAAMAATQMPDVEGGRAVCRPLTHADDGRFGVRAPATLATGWSAPPGARVLVLGTGEYQGPPLRLAQRLATEGVDAWFQATTRAPVRPSGPIESVIEGRDNYGEGLTNYLYNFDRDAWDAVVLCQETPPETACPRLLAATGAAVLHP